MSTGDPTPDSTAGQYSITSTNSTASHPWTTSQMISSTTAGPIKVSRSENLENAVETEEGGHQITCRLFADDADVVVEYYCSYCESVLYKKTLVSMPKDLVKENCLARIVKGV